MRRNTPPCPNAVLEAAAGGSLAAELPPFGAPLPAPVSGGLIKRFEDFHADALFDKLLLAVENYPQFRATAHR